MSEITLAKSLAHSVDRIHGRVLVVSTNAKGDSSKGSEEIKVEVKEIKWVQPGNPNIIVDEIVTGGNANLLTLLTGRKEQHKGRKMSLGGNTKVK